MARAIEVKIVTMEPMVVARFPCYGPEPEIEGKAKVAAWMKKHGLADNPERHRIFGFDTAGASAASPNRGYEHWAEVSSDFTPHDEVKTARFDGGLYAVYRIPKFGNPWETVPQGWQALMSWQEDSPYRMGKGQCLERIVPQGDLPESECPMDLYLSIEKDERSRQSD
jgi:DNA gyrase inhibitor GyrI